MRGSLRAFRKVGGDVLDTRDNEMSLAIKKAEINLKAHDTTNFGVGLEHIAGSLKEIQQIFLQKNENIGNDLLGIRQLLDEIRNLQRENY